MDLNNSYIKKEGKSRVVIPKHNRYKKMLGEIETDHPIDFANLEKCIKTFCEQGSIQNEETFRNEDDGYFSIKTYTKRFYGKLIVGKNKKTFILLHEFKKQGNKKERNDAVAICKTRLEELGEDIEEIKRN